MKRTKQTMLAALMLAFATPVLAGDVLRQGTTTTNNATESTAIAKLAYNATHEELTVTFRNGNAYVYDEIPAFMYRQFEAASSKGRFYQRFIRGRFPASPVASNQHASSRRSALSSVKEAR